MKPKGITLRGYNEGLNIIININAFKDEKHMLHMLKGKLRTSKKFYQGSKLVLSTQLQQLSKWAIDEIKAFLYNDLEVKECVFEEIVEKKKKTSVGVNEGKTKFIQKSIRSGQVIRYNGNLVIIGDVNPGSEIIANGNVIVMGAIRGMIHAGAQGNSDAIVAATSMEPTLVRIGGYASLFSDNEEKPKYPEVIRVKDKELIIEPYLPNKFL